MIVSNVPVELGSFTFSR